MESKTDHIPDAEKKFWDRQLAILLVVLLLWPVAVGVYRVVIIWHPELCDSMWGGMAMDKACEWRNDATGGGDGK